jgi:hypothetical protein
VSQPDISIVGSASRGKIKGRQRMCDFLKASSAGVLLNLSDGAVAAAELVVMACVHLYDPACLSLSPSPAQSVLAQLDPPWLQPTQYSDLVLASTTQASTKWRMGAYLRRCAAGASSATQDADWLVPPASYAE